MKILILILLLIGIIVVSGCTKLLKNKEIDEPNCEVNENGWSCVLTENTSMFSDYTPELSRQNDELREKCENEGGILKCYGFCLPSYTRFCDFPLEDAGRECTDSDQCVGACITIDSECEENCLGECSEYILRLCDQRIEVIKGKTIQNLIICD